MFIDGSSTLQSKILGIKDREEAVNSNLREFDGFLLKKFCLLKLELNKIAQGMSLSLNNSYKRFVDFSSPCLNQNKEQVAIVYKQAQVFLKSPEKSDVDFALKQSQIVLDQTVRFFNLSLISSEKTGPQTDQDIDSVLNESFVIENRMKEFCNTYMLGYISIFSSLIKRFFINFLVFFRS